MCNLHKSFCVLTKLFWDTEELGRWAKLCSTKILSRSFSCVKCKCICVSSFCVLTVRAFWRAEQLRWVENNFEEMRKVDQCLDEMKTVEEHLLRWHVRRDGMRWEELRWGEMRWEELTWSEMKCAVWRAKSAVWSVRKVCAWRCIAPGSRAGHVLWQHLCNSFAQSTHARAWLAHGACKFYRWERSYSISLRQLPPRLVRILPTVYWGIRINQPIWRGHTGFCTLFTWISWPRAHSDRDSWKFVEQILCTLQEGEKLTALAQPKATAMEA